MWISWHLLNPQSTLQSVTDIHPCFSHSIPSSMPKTRWLSFSPTSSPPCFSKLALLFHRLPWCCPHPNLKPANHLYHLTPTNGLMDSNCLTMPGMCLLKNPYSLHACSQVLMQVFATSRPHHFPASHEVSHFHPLHYCWLRVFQSRVCPSVLAFKAH